MLWLSRRSTTTTAHPGDQDRSATLAYLKETPSRVVCYYAPCSHVSVVALCDHNDTEVASYCLSHGRQAVKEYVRALQERIAENEASLEVA